MTRHPPPKISADRPYQLPNKLCPYCGQTLSLRTRQKEHVIGRSFVPKTSLRGSWNLHVWACKPCNGEKADLEDDISSITQFWGAGDTSSPGHPVVAVEAKRKTARSISRRTGRSVARSAESLKFKHNWGPLSVTFTFNAPPQLDERRVHELALLQLRAFFFFLTFNYERGYGSWWRGKLYPLNGALRRDFGNAVQVAFASRTAGWDYRLVHSAANGFFKIAIRKHPCADAWSFALEWNTQYRLVGYFGDEGACETEANALPTLEKRLVEHAAGERYYVRTEVPLHEEQDILFSVSGSSEA